MKNKLLFIFIIGILFISSCGKKEETRVDNHDNNQQGDNNPTELTENPIVKLDKEYYVIGETINLSIENWSNLDEFEIINNNDIAIEKINKLSYKAKRVGEYDITVTYLIDETLTTTITVPIYTKTAYLEVNSENICVGNEIDIWFSHFNDLHEESIDDFDFSINNDNAELNNHTLKALKQGTVTVTATSKQNQNVKGSIVINIVDDKTSLTLQPDKRNIQVGEICKISLTGGYNISDLVFLNSNTEVLRVTKYDTSLEITAVGEGLASFSCYGKEDPSIKSYYNIYVSGVCEVDYISRLIHLAYNEIGTYEGKDGSGHYNNVQKYGEWYGNNGNAWCATFVSWCWFHAGLSNELLVKYQGCSNGMDWCVEKGIFKYKESYTPKTGDIVFFLSSGASHTGIVAYCDGTYIYTIEGNRSNRVDLWRLNVNNNTITGYGVPNYPTCKNPEDMSWIKNEKYNIVTSGEPII